MRRWSISTLSRAHAAALLCCVLFGGAAEATEILSLGVEAEPNGSGEATCIVDTDAGVATVRLRVTGPDGAIVATTQEKAEFAVNWAVPATRKIELEFKVRQPLAWTDEMPVLYGLQMELLGGKGELLAQKATRFAFSRMEVRSDDGFYLNGQKIRLRGINSPVDAWPEDDAARAAACRAAVRDVRWLNANAIWCTNAVPTELLDLCDEAGVFVVGEVAGADGHPCAISWRKSDDVRLVAAPSHSTIRSWARAQQIMLACPLLPQQGEGGLSAGLADCWTAICAAPRCGGGILQAEGPWRAEELGAHGPAIRETWSPVSCSLTGRTLSFVNRNRFVGLDSYRYAWQALSFGERGERVLATGGDACPTARPGGSAQAELPRLPPATQAVRLSVADRLGAAVCTWSFRVPSLMRALDWPSRSCAPPPGLEEVLFIVGSRTNRVRNSKGRVMQSPRFYLDSPPNSSLSVTWGRMADGMYRLDYKLDCRANVEVLGFAFPPLKGASGVRWLGRGPHRVWNNRRQGQEFGLWQSRGLEGGFFSDVDWMEVETEAGTYRFSVGMGTEVLACGAPEDDAAKAFCALPPFGPGVFLRIPGIGGRDFAANETGPEGCGGWVHMSGVHAAAGTLLISWKPGKQATAR